MLTYFSVVCVLSFCDIINGCANYYNLEYIAWGPCTAALEWVVVHVTKPQNMHGAAILDSSQTRRRLLINYPVSNKKSREVK